MKNWFGILGGQRQRLHQRIHESLADLADFLRPTLTLLDAASLRYLKLASDRGLGTTDFERLLVRVASHRTPPRALAGD
jgi:hypothetical protein